MQQAFHIVGYFKITIFSLIFLNIEQFMNWLSQNFSSSAYTRNQQKQYQFIKILLITGKKFVMLWKFYYSGKQLFSSVLFANKTPSHKVSQRKLLLSIC